jgi:2-polyprenyl-3-methyl-5-hydroxy-6-metoxy-1,4-benzoquinol methylase
MSEYTDYGYTYEGGTTCHQYLYPSIKKVLNPEKNQNILDVGCGNGFLTKQLIKDNFNAYGTDASEMGIKIAKKTHPDRFYVQDINSEKLPEQLDGINFDTIISTEVIEHLYNPRLFIKFCYNILKEQKGEIILSTPYHGYLKNLVIALSNKFDHHVNPLWLGGHIKFWSYQSLKKILEEEGFTVIDFVGSGRFPGLWKSMIIKGKVNE